MLERHMFVLVDKLLDDVAVGGGRCLGAFEFESY